MKRLDVIKEMICTECGQYIDVSETYKEGYEAAVEDIRDAMTFHQSGLTGYFIISQNEWERLEEKINENIYSSRVD